MQMKMCENARIFERPLAARIIFWLKDVEQSKARKKLGYISRLKGNLQQNN